MKKTYWAVTLLAVFMGVILLLGKTATVAAAASTGIKNVVLVHAHSPMVPAGKRS